MPYAQAYLIEQRRAIYMKANNYEIRCRCSAVWGRVFEMVSFGDKWLVKPAPTAYIYETK